MRNLEECQAEVFRRSEKRIKARRRRTVRTLAICIPLVLCLASLPLLSGFFPGISRESPATDPAIQLPMGSQPESFVCPIASITVSAPDHSGSVTELSEILAIYDYLAAYDTYSAGGIVDESHQEETTGTVHTYTQSAGVDVTVGLFYTATLVMHDGTQIPYTLIDCTLKNLATGQSFDLPQEDAEQLAKLLQTLPGKD